MKEKLEMFVDSILTPILIVLLPAGSGTVIGMLLSSRIY